MIITLKGADFSGKKIGTLTTWSIFTNLGEGASFTGEALVDRDSEEAYVGVVTLAKGYDIGAAGISVIMGGTEITEGIVTEGTYEEGITITITIDKVTGTVYITVPTLNMETGVEDDGSSVTWLDLPVTKYALGVTSTGTGRVSSNNAKRFSTADDENENGILIPAGSTLHLAGLASGTYPLRVDYIYCTANAKCPVEGSTTAIDGLVGTCSNYVSSNYFPLNKEGEDTIDVTNSYGQDYYFWFGFAGQTLSEGILAEFDTYDIKYYIS